MAITQQEARERILDELAAAVDALAVALSCLGEAFELVSVTAGERMEGELYRPVQKGFGRAKRTHAQFADRCGFPPREFEVPAAGRRSQGAKAFIERAVVAAAAADHAISELQDSMLPIESGDAELRSGLTEVRELVRELPVAAREFLRSLGR